MSWHAEWHYVKLFQYLNPNPAIVRLQSLITFQGWSKSCSHMDNCLLSSPAFSTSERQIREMRHLQHPSHWLYLIWRPSSSTNSTLTFYGKPVIETSLWRNPSITKKSSLNVLSEDPRWITQVLKLAIHIQQNNSSQTRDLYFLLSLLICSGLSKIWIKYAISLICIAWEMLHSIQN